MHVIFTAFAALASTFSLGALAAEPVPREGVWIIEEYIAADSDGDGVKDAADACPQSLIGAIVNKQGCALMVESLRGYKRVVKTQFKKPDAIPPAR